MKYETGARAYRKEQAGGTSSGTTEDNDVGKIMLTRGIDDSWIPKITG